MWRIRKFLQKTREKIHTFRDRIPRKTQVAINLALIPILLFLFYIFIGSPALSWEHQYRRIEKANMVGPGEILGYEEVTGMLYDKIVLAKTSDALIVSTISLGKNGNDILLYLPKRDGIMVLGAPQDLEQLLPTSTMTVFAVDDRQAAVRAEMDLELYWQQFIDEEPQYPVFHLQAPRKEGGYYRFDIPYGVLKEESVQWNTLRLFSAWSRDTTGIHVPEDAYRATVRLYDSQNKLIGQETVNLQSIKRK